MKGVFPHRAVGGLALAGAVLFLLAGWFPGPAQDPKVLNVGVIESLFPDAAPAEAKGYLDPLNTLVQKHTGRPCRSILIKDAEEIGAQLKAGKLEVGVVNGFEYAWLQPRHPKLKPLAVAVIGKYAAPVACLVTSRDSPIKGFADLKGKEVSLPLKSRAYVTLFLHRAEAKDKGIKEVRTDNIEDALDDVVLGKLPAVVVDGPSLDGYKAIKPGAFKRLKIVQQSAPFPGTVVLYQEGSLDASTVQNFRQGLYTAHKDPENEPFMKRSNITEFVPPPANYNQLLTDIRKAYPPPAKGP